MSVAAIIVAAGRGSRAGDGPPKQYRILAGRPMVATTLDAFLRHRSVDAVLAVIHPEDEQLFQHSVQALDGEGSDKLLPWTPGGETRQDSVRHGLEALVSSSPDLVLIHDAARPFAGEDLIQRAIDTARSSGAAVPGVLVTDTIKVVGPEGEVVETPDRSRLRAVQTPQAFRYSDILQAHRSAARVGLSGFTDDASLAEWAGLAVHVFDGEPGNRKLTHPEDFITPGHSSKREDFMAPGLASKGSVMTYLTRLGTGFDVHAFTGGDHVWLGGVRVPHHQGVLAHSDGDVILHALTDAVLGALADGDIGVHFPPSDPQWRGASSDRFLADAVERVRSRGGVVDHLDATLLCEAPRLGPHREAIRRRIAEIARLRLDQVSVKATTTEKMGFTGRGEGLAAQAAATIRLPEGSA
jgi:2-C-methyl-D-erythritol 4-phosphate cytidylyltransferase / 2-C-methyl-D-erythritol 2,4-cyclodiphosphate synthase